MPQSSLKKNPVSFLKRRKPIFWILLVAAMVSGLQLSGLPARWVSKLNVLRIRDVKISCEWPLTPENVRTWLPRVEGQSILNINASSLVKLIKQKPWVAEVAIKKGFPDRLLIEVKTKKPRVLRIYNGQVYFVDGSSNLIERAASEKISRLDLPLLSYDPTSAEEQWEFGDVLHIVDTLEDKLPKTQRVSQLVLNAYPYFKVFLATSRVELLFSHETWESQISNLLVLITHPPMQLGELQKINLIQPKKAIVSSSLSNYSR